MRPTSWFNLSEVNMSNFCEKIIKIWRKSKTFQSCKRIFLCLGGFIGAALSRGGQGRTGGLLGSLPASLQPTGNIGSGPTSICLLLMWLWWLMLLETSTDKHSGWQLQIHFHLRSALWNTESTHCQWEETAEEILIMIPILTKYLRSAAAFLCFYA